MNMHFKAVFDYKGDSIMRLLGNETERKIKDSLERLFVSFHNLYADYVNSDKGYETWNKEWRDLYDKEPITNDFYMKKYNDFIAEKGNSAIKELIVNADDKTAMLFEQLNFYVEPENAQLHCNVKGTPIDISLHLEEIK